jgi:predicted CoA-binding protein
MATDTRTRDLSELRDKVLESLQDIGYGNVGVEVVWLTVPPEEAEVLVEVALPDPGKRTWSQEMTNKISTAIREATAEVMPWAVATTRMVPINGDA